MNSFSEALDYRFDGSENINPGQHPWYRSQAKEGRELLFALLLDDSGEAIGID